MKIIQRHIDVVTRLAETIDEVSGGARVAALIARGHRVIAFGKNAKKTHPFNLRFRKNADAVEIHAEVAAIQAALTRISSRELRKCTLYIVRVKRPSAQSDEWVTGLAKPCEGCSRAIATFNIKNVVYSTDDDGRFVVL